MTVPTQRENGGATQTRVTSPPVAATPRRWRWRVWVARGILGCAVAAVVMGSWLVRVKSNVAVPVYGSRPPVLALLVWCVVMISMAVTALAVAFAAVRWLVVTAWDGDDS